jgi:hypothetical protein
MDRLTRIIERARNVETAPAPTSLPKPDPAAIADAIIAKGRLRAATRRARTERAALEGWDAETMPGETIACAMARVISEGLPPPIQIVHAINLMRLREQYCSLPADEQRDEMERHDWARSGEGRVRTHYSPLFDAMGFA